MSDSVWYNCLNRCEDFRECETHVCSIFFQSKAGKVAALLSAASAQNEALAAFRKKMISNLARGGLWDMSGEFVILA